MTRPRDRRLPSTLTEEEVRLLTAPAELPSQPWRYTITPNLVDSLVRIADAAGQMTAAPLSYYRRKELEARAKLRRIIWVVGGSFQSVKLAEAEAVLGGARLVEKREPIAEAIRRAAIVEDALAHYATARGSADNRLTPELAMAYERASQPMSPLRPGRWMAYSTRERGKLLELHKDAGAVPGPVRAMFDWTNQDPLVSKSAVLRAATLYWGLKRLYPAWRSVSVVLHHELRAGRVDANGLLMLTEATVAQHELLDTARINLLETDQGDLTKYFELFTSALLRVLWERLEALGRVRDNEEHLPWKVVAPPDAIDANLYEVVERLGQAGSAAIVAGLGKNAPPLRTVQRRLQKLVSDGVLAKRGARKNAVYTLAGRDGSG
jgi:hypothetical protein